MSTNAPSWVPTRWREGQPSPMPYEGWPAAPHAASTAVRPTASSSVILEPYTPAWNRQSRPDLDHHPLAPELPSPSDPYTTASNYFSRMSERHSPPPGGNYGPPEKSNASSLQPRAGAWRSLHVDDREQRIPDAPLTLQIPNQQHLPRISPAYNALKPDSPSYHSSLTPLPQTATSLPSFAAFQEHAARHDEPDVADQSSVSSLLPCNTCIKLKPLVRSVAIAVAEIDEQLQASCNGPVSKAPEFQSDAPLRTIQWVLDRLRSAKTDLQDAARRSKGTAYSTMPPLPSSAQHSHSITPPHSLKRSTESWENDDQPPPKRPRSGASLDEYRTTTSALPGMDDRRGSIDFATRDSWQRSAYSPPPSESGPGSAHPRHGSPMLAGRAVRALPSPSSLAYPPSAAPSVAPATAQSVGSPAMSYMPPASIHSASTSSATSAHVADLQHQVTLKSLALQTLQSEYASLLSKLQRERVKSQAIEKKTTVADQEVNDLMSRNEELTDQVKGLETQLADSEKKRELERADAAREKEQWSRMLDMGGRLHAKNAEERQKLLDEKSDLAQRLASFEDETTALYHGFRSKGFVPRTAEESVRRASQGSGSAVDIGQTAGPSGNHAGDVPSLQREISNLKSRIDHLRLALEETRRQNQELDERIKDAALRSGKMGAALSTALDDDKAIAKAEAKRPKVSTTLSPIAPRTTGWAPTLTPTTFPPPPRSPRAAESHKGSNASSTSSATVASVASMAGVARASSPGPAELGFHVLPSTSSPEELIRALGPVPAPLPIVQYGTALFSNQPAPKQKGKQQRKRSAGGAAKQCAMQNVLPQQDPSNQTATASFRPLTHHVPLGHANMHKLITHTAASPLSYHSSPGPFPEDLSSVSSGSGRGRSPDTAPTTGTSSGTKDDKSCTSTTGFNSTPPSSVTPTQDQANRSPHGLLHPSDAPEGQGQAYTMPPPPRPAGCDSTSGAKGAKH